MYVATPHPCTTSTRGLALAAGKQVLCEKPMTLNAAAAEELFGGPASTGAS